MEHAIPRMDGAMCKNMEESVSKAYSVLLFTEMGVEHKCASGRTEHVSWTLCEKELYTIVHTACEECRGNTSDA